MTTITVVSARSSKIRPIILGKHPHGGEGALDLLPHNGQYGNLITLREIDRILDRIDDHDHGTVVLSNTEAMAVCLQGWQWAGSNYVGLGPDPNHEARQVRMCLANPSSALAQHFVDQVSKGGDGWLQKILLIAHMNRKYKDTMKDLK